MGKSESKPYEPPPSVEFVQPWRTMQWGDKNNLETELRNFELSTSHEYVRILVIGEVGAGKSSFINSINTVFQGQITSDALVAVTSGSSFTKDYKTYYIKGNDGSHLPFAFSDIMGLESEDGQGAHEKDLIAALKGLLKEGYKFNPVNPASPEEYKNSHSVGDQVFCLVNVLAADKLSLMKENVFKKMKLIHDEASAMNLPQVIILTKVDVICPLVHDDIRKVYTSKKIKEKMSVCSNLLGVPINHIFPVKNYNMEVDTDNDIDVLILKALKQIVNFASDAMNKQMPFEKNFDKPWRMMPWGDEGNMKQTLMNFELSYPDIQYVKILIIGEVGSGKSSFINSVTNALQGRITSNALVAAPSGSSFTKVYKTHYMMGRDGSCLPFVFSDTMGLEPEDNCGAHVQDVKFAMKGFLKEDYKFDPHKPVSVKDRYYRKNPKVKHQTFCLVNILAADKLLLMDQSVIKKMKIIHEEASQLDIPQVIILTKVDKTCRLVRKDIKKVYTSRKIKDQMQECSNWFGIPLSHIFPVKNYSEEVNTDANMDILILKALEHIMNLASDALKSQTLIISEIGLPCICRLL